MPEIFDLTEAQFYLGEIARIIPMWEAALEDTKQPIEDIKAEMKPYEDEIKRLRKELKPLKEELVDWQTQAGDYRSKIADMLDTRSKIESILDKLVTEPQATQFVKEQAKLGRFNFMDGIHHKPDRMIHETPSIHEYRMIEKVCVTLRIKRYDRGYSKETELYTTELWGIPDAYIEFFAKLNVPVEEEVEEKV